MSVIFGKGKPAPTTEASLGDVYLDRITNEQYKCTFSYKGPNDERFNCEWTQLEKDEYVPYDFAKSSDKPVESKPVETTVREEEPLPVNKKNYANMYNKNK